MATGSPLDKTLLSGQLTPSQIREQRRIRAKRYRDLYLLPRYVVEPDGSKRKLEAGEYDPNSKLYPICTPIKDLSDFGIGLGMYFTTTMWFGIMMLICAAIQTPAVAYFGSSKYDSDGSHDRTYKTFGSAACLQADRVCMDTNCSTYAGEFHYPDPDIPRFSNDYDAAGEAWRDDEFRFFDDDYSTDEYSSVHSVGAYLRTATNDITSPSSFVGLSKDGKDKFWVGKRNCDLHYSLGVYDLAMIIFIASMLLVLGWRQDKEAEELDEMEQTAQDYSVEVEDPNPEVTNPDEWKRFFENLFGPVFMVTVCLNNGDLMRLFKHKRFLERELKFEEAEEQRYSDLGRERNEEDNAKSCFKQIMEGLGLDPTVETFKEELLKVDKLIKAELDREKPYRATKVFVIFNEEQSQRKCLESMCVGLIPSLLDASDSVPMNMQFKGNVLAIKEAPEPSSILYENLDIGIATHIYEQLVSWFVLFIALCCAYFSIESAFSDGQTVAGALLISVWNGALPELNRYMVTSFEHHHNTEDLETSFLSKTITARWFTSSIILYLVGLDHSSQLLSPYYIGSIQAVLLADAITSPIVRLMDLGGVFNRYVLAPIAGTDGRAKSLFIGTDYLLAERYTDLAKTVLMSLFFSAIFPVGYWYSALACFLCFWVDKICILRLFRQKPPAGDRLVRVTRTFTAIVIIVHVIITAHFYYGWPFDGLCETDSVLNEAGKLRADMIGVSTEKVYKQCDSFSTGFLPPVRHEPWFADGQYNLVAFFNIITITLIVYVTVTYLGKDSAWSIYSLFYYKHQAVGECSSILFETVESGEGYVPQFEIEGDSHAISCCQAPNDKEKLVGGYEFSPYLLNWTASKEQTGDEVDQFLNEGDDLTEEEKDALYRESNCYFDKMLTNYHRRTCFGSAKQYIVNQRREEEACPSHLNRFNNEKGGTTTQSPLMMGPEEEEEEMMISNSGSRTSKHSANSKSGGTSGGRKAKSGKLDDIVMNVGGGLRGSLGEGNIRLDSEDSQQKDNQRCRGKGKAAAGYTGLRGSYVDDVTSRPAGEASLEKLLS